MELRRDFLKQNGIELSPEQEQTLADYAAMVWQKRGDLNLTSVSSEQEIWDRHISDGLMAAALIKKLAAGLDSYSLADYGAGCGYIGLSAKIALGSSCELTLVETLGKRCMFMDWCIMKLGIKGAKTYNIRALSKGGQSGPFDFTLERAMGKIDDILPICTADLKRGGYFVAFQTEEGSWGEASLKAADCKYDKNASLAYKLYGEEKERHLCVFGKE